MLRKVLIFAVCAGSSASVPILFEANPETVQRVVDRVMTGKPAPIPTGTRIATATPGQSASPIDRKVRLGADARGHFNGDFRMNGRRIDAMIDTGATLVALNLTTARKLGVPVAPSDFRYTVETANGTTPAASVRIASIQIGRIVIENVDAVVLEDRSLTGTLIGASFLNRLGRYEVSDGTLLMIQ